MRTWVCLVAVVLPAVAAVPDGLARQLKAVESRYNSARTLEVAFTEAYSPQGRGRRVESGTLFLRKPGRMRWQYTQPEGKLFVGDGKFFWLYSPSSNRVQKTQAKETEDMRAPLAFLLGRLHFEKDFRGFESRPQEGGIWVTAEPKSADLPYTKVEFLVAADAAIRRVVVTGQDRTVLDFTFADEKRNPALADMLFRFTPPAGAEMTETDR